MKSILVLSGKGGTGKTTMVASFIELGAIKAFADCDVDAPNLHLVNRMDVLPSISQYVGMDKAHINIETCTSCGKCMEHCRFDAIETLWINDKKVYQVNPYACEGCSVCEVVCPVDAINMSSQVDGEYLLYKDEVKTFSTATLRMGSGTSGKLVTQVKKNLNEHIDKDKLKVCIIDGSPGIGCPVISSISGVDLILVVTEPTVSGISDMKRVIEVAEHFKTSVAVCTNKYNINIEKTEEIIKYTEEKGIRFVGVVPYDNNVAKATNMGTSIMSMDSEAGKYINKIYENTMKII